MLNSPESMYLVWGAELTFFYNDAYRPILGPRWKHALGCSLPSLWPEAWASLDEPLKEAFAGRPVRFEDVPIIAPDEPGKEKWWSYSFSPIRDEKGQVAGVLCLMRETTDHVMATQALRASEQRLDALIRSSSEVRFSISADWSELHELKGGNFIPDTYAGNPNWLAEYIPAPARDAVRAEFERAIRTRSTYNIEHPVNRVGGDIGWAQVRAVPLMDKNDVITGWLGAASDITERKRAEAALREREAQLRHLNTTLEEQVAERTAKLQLFRDVIEANAVPTCIFDRELRQIAFNHAHVQAVAFLFDRQVREGDVLPELLPKEQADILREQMARALKGETFRVVAELGADGTAKRSYEFAYTPLRDAFSEVIGAFYFAHDITARIQSQLELEQTQSALRQAQKLESVGQLTGGVAHDFNNLLTVIRSSCDLLKRPGLPEERRLRYVKAISDTVDRASRLTAQLLAFARRQTLKPEVFDVCESIRSLTDMLGSLIGSQISILADLPEQACKVFADSNQFDTALINMALNARDAMERSGEILIRVESVGQMPTARRHAATGEFVAISISDSGSGIPADMLESIFEPFFSTKELGKGTGLGLSQVFGFAKQSGGEIQVASEVGKGSTFTLYLPRVATEIDQNAALERQAEPLPDDHGTRVLVVEDNREIGELCVTGLIEFGYRPVLVPNAEEALKLLTDEHERIDVVFSDVVMPGMNGLELGKAIRKRNPLMPVILASGYSEVLVKHGSYGFELLQKPYSLDQLSDVLTKAVRSNPL
jgi:PAS domain S-box-containing protein